MIFITIISLSFNNVSAANETTTDNNINELITSTDTVNSYNSDNTSQTFEITQDNYENYFNLYTGEIKPESHIKSGDTLKISNITNRAFVIDRQLTLMPSSNDSSIVNGFIHLTKGSDGSTITNLTINNTKGVLSINTQDVGMLHGIWLSDTNNITLAFNTIRIANTGGVYAIPMHSSSNNRIINNDMKTWISSNIIMANCNNNLISNNRIEVLSYSDYSVTNLIYFCPFAFAGRLEPSLCVGNTIVHNELIGFSTLPMSIIIQAVYDNNVNTTIAHNIIYKGSYAVNLFGDNSLVYNNTINNSATGISATGANISVIDNSVSGISQKTGIIISGRENITGIASGNNISFVDVLDGMVVGDYADVYNNKIYIRDYGVGIRLNSNYSKVHKNNVRTSYDEGIVFLSDNSVIHNNIIITNSKGISITTEGSNRYYYNTISYNKISSNDYGIFLKGLVYNTTISSNIIETNASSGIYREITDEASDYNHDNMINGIIYDSTSLIINDTNFNDYFDNNCFNYTFAEDEPNTVFLTFLSNKNLIFNDKINIISNKMNNLLYNVTITLKGDASGSLIRDFNFMNFDKDAIILDGVGNVNVESNNITIISSEESSNSIGIFVLNSEDSNIISNNNIYINSKANYTYGISISAYNPYTSEYSRKLSKGFVISQNSIIIISDAMAEAIFSDSIVESEISSNKINIISKRDAYGIGAVNVIGRLYGWNISDNEIVIHSNQMAYLIENHMADNMTVENNYFYSESNGAYGVACYNSSMVLINDNDFNIIAGDLSNVVKAFDVIPPGNAAIYLSGDSDLVNISNNVIYVDAIPVIHDDCSVVDYSNNSYIIDDNNYLVYFNDGLINSSIVGDNDNLLLSNITVYPTFMINIPVNVFNYNKHNVSLDLIICSSDLIVSGLNFVDSNISLVNASNITVIDNVFVNSKLFLINSFSNYLSNNTFGDYISLSNSYSNTIESNEFNIQGSGEVIIIDGSNNNHVVNNSINAVSDSLKIIKILNSDYNYIADNMLNANGSNICGVYGFNSSSNRVKSNYIHLITSSQFNQSAILITDNSSDNLIADNYVLFDGYDYNYAVCVISDENLNNNVTFNYLISGLRRANSAVYALYDFVSGNSPYDIYVSVYGSDVSGDGSQSRPFASLSYALRNSLNHVVIRMMNGTFFESNLVIDRNVTIVGSDSACIDAGNNQLFVILDNASLTVDSLIFRNAFDVKGGSLFKNNGSLVILNSVVCNSSSYFDNSHPVFDDIIDDEHSQTYDCRHDGMGGAVLNYGDLLINNSVFYGNFAHIGGVIADFGKLSVLSSVFHSNHGIHGGVIFSDSNNALSVVDSLFVDNWADITWDYCMVKKSVSGWSIDSGNSYSYSSLCDLLTGAGGAIYSLSDLYVNGTVFNHNAGWKGGAIATKYVSSGYNVVLNVDLTLDNCSFINNRATNETKVIGSNWVDAFPFNRDFDGGAVYGSFDKLSAVNCEFSANHAQSNGGAFYVQSNDGFIDLCNFIDNRAGFDGGALDISNNFLITRTVISNNSASYGGAINYQSYSYYNHVQDNLNIYNSTISNNMALESGGAFRIGQSNITVHDSNIYDNFAPQGSTMSASYITDDPGRVSADMRYNWWGADSNGNARGADNSVYNFPNVQTGRKSNTRFNWIVEGEGDGGSVVPVNPDSSDDNNHDVVVNPSGTTSSSQSTNSRVGVPDISSGGGVVIGPYGVPGDGLNPSGGGFSPFDGNSESGNASNVISNVPVNGNVPTSGGNGVSNDLSNLFDELRDYINSNTRSSSQNSVVRNSTDNRNSVSTADSRSYDDSLNTVGVISNAVAVSPDVSSGQAGSSASSDSSSSKSYELEDKSVKKEIDYPIAVIGMFCIVFLLLAFGYKRGKNDDL